MRHMADPAAMIVLICAEALLPAPTFPDFLVHELCQSAPGAVLQAMNNHADGEITSARLGITIWTKRLAARVEIAARNTAPRRLGFRLLCSL
jgi:hypothetical protein